MMMRHSVLMSDSLLTLGGGFLTGGPYRRTRSHLPLPAAIQDSDVMLGALLDQ
jgi:hypothetical protein